MKKNRNLNILLSGQLVSQIGDKIYMIALSFWVLDTTGSPSKMGIVLAAALIPSLLLGFISGVFIDRYDRKKILIITDLFRGVIILLVVFCFYTGILNFPIIILSQILLSVNAAFFDPAIPSILPQIVEKSEITKANSKHQFIRGFSTILGPILGGMLFSLLGFELVFFLNGASFLLSALFETFLKIPKSRSAEDSDNGNEPAASGGMISEATAGYRYLFSDRILITTLVMVAVIHIFFGAIEVMMPVIASHLARHSTLESVKAGARTFGYFQAGFGMGAVAMAALLSAKSFIGREGAVLFGSIGVISILFLLLSFPLILNVNHLLPYLVLFFFIGAFFISAGNAFKSILKLRVDNRFAGRVFAIAGSIGNGSIPAAMIFYGFLLEKISVTYLLLFSGLLLLPLSILLFQTFIRVEQKTARPVRVR